MIFLFIYSTHKLCNLEIYPIKLNTTKNKTRQQNAKSPKAFSCVTALNSVDDVNCIRNETAQKYMRM